MVFRNRALVASLAAFSLTGGLVAAPIVLSAAPAQAQKQSNVGQLLSGLINVGINIGEVNVPVTVNDVTLEELVVVDVDNVLNNNQVDILRNAIQNNPIASNNQDVLNNLLRDALPEPHGHGSSGRAFEKSGAFAFSAAAFAAAAKSEPTSGGICG
jgi:uncharacterized protein involved in propanediol utilization